MMKYYYLALTVFAIKVSQAQIINIPDANFKAKLLASGPTSGVARDENDVNLTIDLNSDGEVELSEIIPVRKLNLPGDEIADLTGIASFTNLTDLNVNANYLTTLDVSGLLQLEWLWCDSNQLTTLLVSPGLEFLGCSSNQLTSLDLSNCSALQNIHCNSNQLVSLDLSNKPDLHTIYCSQNVLTDLNIANSPNVLSIWCSNNSISEIDLSYATQLGWLECDNNQITSIDLSAIDLPEFNILFLYCSTNLLTSLDLSVANCEVLADCSNNPNLTFIDCMGTGTFYDFNPHEPPFPGLYFPNLPNLTHICADAVNFGYLNNKILDYGYTGVTVDATCTLRNDDFAEVGELTVYPNPANGVLHIRVPNQSPMSSAKIYNSLGQLLITASGSDAIGAIDVSGLAAGQYFLSIASDNGIHRAKFIKNN